MVVRLNQLGVKLFLSTVIYSTIYIQRFSISKEHFKNCTELSILAVNGYNYVLCAMFDIKCLDFNWYDMGFPSNLDQDSIGFHPKRSNSSTFRLIAAQFELQFVTSLSFGKFW